MKILVLSATDFISKHAVRYLAEWGHTVRVLQGDWKTPTTRRAELEPDAPEVVIHLDVSGTEDAQVFMDAFDGLAKRVVVAGSVDVYRAFGRHYGTEPGPRELFPILEDDPLREKPLFSHRSFDKTLIERIVANRPTLPATILRIPMMMYGPGDMQHHFASYLKAMDDRRPQIVLSETGAAMRLPRGYCEDIGYAFALAAKNKKAEGRIYNVTDAVALTLADTIRALGRAAGWEGTVMTAPDEHFTKYPDGGDPEQQLIVDSSRVRQELGYIEQVPFNEAISRTVAWERAHPPADGAFQPLDYAREDAILARLQAESGEPKNPKSS